VWRNLQKFYAKEEIKMKRVVMLSGLLVLSLVVSTAVFAADKAKKQSVPGAAAAKEVKDKATGMEFVFVKGGCYLMGDVAGEVNKDETPSHRVCVSDFYLGKYEVTRDQWQKISGSIPDGNDRCSEANCPVENIGWQDAVEFIQALNKKSKAKYRLPTEAEWEYAARSGGRDEKYAGGSDLDAVAWHAGNSSSTPHPVGMKNPNGLGLYDMTGNVMEWCSDYYREDYYGKSPEKDPKGPAGGADRVQRGGHYADEDVRWLRTVNRRSDNESRPVLESYGLRLVLPVK